MTCNGPSPGHMDICSTCEGPAPACKIGASEILYKKGVLTAAGHAAARAGQKEGDNTTYHQGRAAKGKGELKRQGRTTLARYNL